MPIKNDPRLPRGIRNNNPGNLRDSTVFQWLGQTGTDGAGFCQFLHGYYGLRALMITLHTYFYLHNLTTVHEIMQRFAPPGENDTADYERFVCGRLGVQPVQRLELPDMMVPLAKAIVTYENGQDPYGPNDYQLALSSSNTR